MTMVLGGVSHGVVNWHNVASPSPGGILDRRDTVQEVPSTVNDSSASIRKQTIGTLLNVDFTLAILGVSRSRESMIPG